jgi:hypothetical protein
VTGEPRIPFIGPRPFTEADSSLFFGRDRELAALTAEVVSTQIVLVYAPSGSGKSSLISAGLVPAMRKEGFAVRHERPKARDAAHARSPVDDLTHAISQSVVGGDGEQPPLLVFDQFEEVIAGGTDAELRSLADTAYAAMAKDFMARLVISFREEYLARVDGLFNKVTDVTVGKFHLHRLSTRGAAEAFERSLGQAGFQVDPEAGGLFLERLAPPTRRVRSEAGLEPLYLQLLGTQLWSSISDRAPDAASQSANGHPKVTVDDVQRLVDLDHAIERFFNSTIADVCARHPVSEKVLRDWIDRELVTPDETRSMVRRQAAESRGVPIAGIDELVKVGLLRTEPRGDEVWIELAHDQLVERVWEFNRRWWARRVNARLLDRATRWQTSMDASSTGVQRWSMSRLSFWNLGTSVRESGIHLSRRYRRWSPFSRTRPSEEVDRLALRAFVLTGGLLSAGLALYRTSSSSSAPAKGTAVEGLDAEMAKRRLQATALNLGPTPQILAAANVGVTVAWVTWLSRFLMGAAIGRTSMEKLRRWAVGGLLCADLALTLLRWVVRDGLFVNCLEPAAEAPRAHPTGSPVRRCRRLQEAASWSQGGPVLLVADWRAGVASSSAYERFADEEVALYANALWARGAIVAWCCRADVRRPGWRDEISGIGFPRRGQRTYYMIENGSVVAWREVKASEFPAHLRTAAAGATPESAQFSGREAQITARFKAILTSLIVDGEAVPSFWRAYVETYFKSALGPRRRDDRVA